MKKSIIFFFLLVGSFLAKAQNELQIRHSDKGSYLEHTVTAKENFYSVGRLYNIAPKDIAALNDLDMTKGLNIGQTLKIPLNTTNFSQTSNKGRPVYYVVGEKEGLYRVSTKNNQVLMANLRKWNNLANDNIAAGKKLIVGYLVSPEAGNITPANTTHDKEVLTMQEPKKDPVQESGTTKTSAADTEVKQSTEKKPEPPVSKPATTVSQTAVTDGNGGYFKSFYEKQVKAQPAKTDETVTAGIFKTASGWQDAKYYALIDHVEPGTIVRIVNPSNNKAVYAKV
ncbi:MAG TPA: LysM peptidoglycan-binding domain-containing protein, partial [Flavisolibacter sp.]|nr:LysM peptidoglycan-binding domain-containing protein [Flavisolibacter sp.]